MAVQQMVPELRETTEPTTWRPWCVAETSGFEVCDPAGQVGLVQIDTKTFLVANRFRFSDPEVEQALIDQLLQGGASAEDARRAVEDARTFSPSTENPTDLASVPLFMRWFENSYGAHTLAAIIHDELIVKEANGGALGSDTLADRFFREMMRSAGVPWLKRWIMWAAVALRSRWAAAGYRRASVVAWVVLAISGITSFAWGVGAIAFSWSRPVDGSVLLAIGVVLPFLSAPLWGRQFGAALVAAIGALWILPAAVFGGFGYLVYRVLELLAAKVGLD